jgi:hypothetical protein
MTSNSEQVIESWSTAIEFVRLCFRLLSPVILAAASHSSAADAATSGQPREIQKEKNEARCKISIMMSSDVW